MLILSVWCYREVLRCTMITHQILLRGAAQCFLLKSALCLTDVVRHDEHTVQWVEKKKFFLEIVQLYCNF